MRAFLCPNCGAVYDGDNLKLEEGDCGYDIGWCPIPTCGCKVFEVDEEMIIPLRILNKKGYITSFSCSGHIYDKYGGGYIAFREKYPFKSVPKGWYKDDENDMYPPAIRFTNKADCSDEERRTFIHTKITNLIKWVKELDEFVYIPYDESTGQLLDTNTQEE